MFHSQCATFQGQRLSCPRAPLAKSSRQQQQKQRSQRMRTSAFWKKKVVVVEPPPPPPKKGLFDFLNNKKSEPAAAAPAQKSKGFMRKGKKEEEKPPPARKQTFLEALDFSEVRSYEDAKLLSDAKYGVRGKDGKMTREQYNALRRKVGGTAKSFFKESVEAKGKYLEKGYVARDTAPISEGIPGLPFLIAVVLGIFGALGYVVSQT